MRTRFPIECLNPRGRVNAWYHGVPRMCRGYSQRALHGAGFPLAATPASEIVEEEIAR